MIRFPLVQFLVISAAVLAGCSQTVTQSPDANSQAQLVAAANQTGPQPEGFGWSTQTLYAEANVSPEKLADGSGQKLMLAKNSARLEAQRGLRQQVRALPVGSDQTVGSIMDSYLAVRRAVDKQIQQATVADEQRTAQGYQVRLQMGLTRVAEILSTNMISPTEELPPAVQPDESELPPVT